MDKILLIGAGGHAISCIDVIEQEGRFEIAGLVEKDENTNKGNLGYPIVGTDDNLFDLHREYSNAFVTVGQIKTPAIRIKLYQMLQGLEYTLPVIIAPKAYVSNYAQIGEGSIVMHGAIVNANARIGKNCIINNKVLVEHDTVIGDHCHISTGAIINGEVNVGGGSFIGSGSVIKNCITIGMNCVIGLGSVIKSDISDNQLVKN